MVGEGGGLHGAFNASSPLFPSLGLVLMIEATFHFHTLVQEALTHTLTLSRG